MEKRKKKKCRLKHIRNKKGEKQKNCKTGGKDFRKSSNVSVHIRSVHQKESNKCQHCDKVFTLKETLLAHTKHAHLGEGFLCEHCSKSFSSTQKLSFHLLAWRNKKFERWKFLFRVCHFAEREINFNWTQNLVKRS